MTNFERDTISGTNILGVVEHFVALTIVVQLDASTQNADGVPISAALEWSNRLKLNQQISIKESKVKANNKFNFTIKQLQAVPLPKGQKRLFYYDLVVPGLAVMVTANGTKTFYVYKKIQGKPEKIRVGRFPETTIEQARKKANSATK